MTTAADYRRYARECIDSANDALTEPVRQQFLDLATLWLTAAERMETRPGPLPQNQNKVDGSRAPGSGSGK
jgi:hypothetical protein